MWQAKGVEQEVDTNFNSLKKQGILCRVSWGSSYIPAPLKL